MKARTSFSLIFSAVFILSFSAWAQDPNLLVEGSATGNRLVKLDASDLDGNNDILEIEAPTAPSGEGQFIECQVENGTIMFQVSHTGTSFFKNDMNINSAILISDNGTNASAEILMEDNSDNEVLVLRTKDISSDIGGEILLRGGSGALTTIELDGNWGGTGLGRIRTDELEIEGADIAEQFDIAAASPELGQAGMPKPGMLVAIHSQLPGQLQVTRSSYDKMVAGVISGANGVRTGMYLGQPGSIVDGEFPVAVAGRVYVFADASFGAIEPGDLLTSSPTPGHAMKVKNHRKARGAIVGKAMTVLESGQGYVLMLVNLQ